MQQVRKASKNVTQQRENLIAIMKKRKTLEKLKEKERLEYQQKGMQAERKFNDEVASTRHIRKM
jgi:flagellar export protein FliJ